MSDIVRIYGWEKPVDDVDGLHVLYRQVFKAYKGEDVALAFGTACNVVTVSIWDSQPRPSALGLPRPKHRAIVDLDDEQPVYEETSEW